MSKIIGITMGDPAGIGPELCLKTLSDNRLKKDIIPVVYGDARILEKVAVSCGISFDFNIVSIKQWQDNPVTDIPLIIDCNATANNDVVVGKIQKICGYASYIYIKNAVKDALNKHIDAMATGPIHKVALNMAGINFPGHTELIANMTDCYDYCMMMASDAIKVSLVTTHKAIKSVPALLTPNSIFNVIRITDLSLKRIGIKKPSLAVLGLNPHSGEDGLFGDEEAKIILPAIKMAQENGIMASGPVVPDTAYLPEKTKCIDAYIVMYHDQGLIPFKMLAFDKGVNITLGLPIVRTSVDHGTAYDIAGKNIASYESMVQSVLWAARLSK